MPHDLLTTLVYKGLQTQRELSLENRKMNLGERRWGKGIFSRVKNELRL
jgi:hypothetical protein